MPSKIEQLAIDYLGHRTGRTDELRAAIDAKYPGAVERSRARADKATFEQKFVGPVPDWAKRYVAKYAPRLERLTIRQSRSKRYSSGHCRYYGPIVVTFGYTPKPRPGETPEAIESMREEAERAEGEKRVVVLHELAHHRAPMHGHDEKFAAELHRMVVAEHLTAAHAARHGRRRVLKGKRAASPR